jgi:hypothetical protein
MTVSFSPLGGFAAQFFDNNGVILSGGKIFTYATGTTTPQATYTNSLGNTAHTNPIILDSAGRVPGGEIWLTDGLTYKFVIETSTGSLLGTYNDIVGVVNAVELNKTLRGPDAQAEFANAANRKGLLVQFDSNGALVTSSAEKNSNFYPNFWMVQNDVRRTLTAPHVGNSQAVISFTMETLGSGAFGPPNSDNVMFTRNTKTNYLTSTQEGETNVHWGRVQQGRKGDASVFLGVIDKVAGLPSVALGANPFAAVSGSPILTVTENAHGRLTGAYVRFNPVTAFAGFVPADFALPFQITVASVNTYTITASVNATSTASGGGSSVFASVATPNNTGTSTDYSDDSGAGIVMETQSNWVDLSGAVLKRLQTGVNYQGQSIGGFNFYGASGPQTAIGFWAEAQIGAQYAALVADQSQSTSGALFENFIVHTKDRLASSTIYRVDGAGSTYTQDCTILKPAYSFQSDQDTGMLRPIGGGIGFSVDGVLAWYIGPTRALLPGADDTFALGGATARPTELYAISGTINTSDAREKTNFLTISEAEYNVGLRLVDGIQKYKWISAIDKKGNGARTHVGVIAQEVKAAFEAEGLEAEKYGAYCYDEWEEHEGPSGNTIPAGNRLGVRYDQVHSLAIAALSAKIKKLEEAILAIEGQNS